jgi:hypothetical protein
MKMAVLWVSALCSLVEFTDVLEVLAASLSGRPFIIDRIPLLREKKFAGNVVFEIETIM